MTATGTPAIIESLLLARAALMVSQGPSLPVSMPDAAFTVPSDGKYLEVRNLRNRPAWESLASDGPHVSQGILTVIVHWPKLKGSIPYTNVAGAVEAFFPKGLALSASGIKITVYRKPWSSQPDINTDTQVTVSIAYRANVAG